MKLVWPIICRWINISLNNVHEVLCSYIQCTLYIWGSMYKVLEIVYIYCYEHEVVIYNVHCTYESVYVYVQCTWDSILLCTWGSIFILMHEVVYS